MSRPVTRAGGWPVAYRGRPETGLHRSITLTVLALHLFGCSDSRLERTAPPEPFRDDKLTLEGEYCTLPPQSRVSPMRVLFVVDSSESMRVTDPGDPVSGETGRERAVRETWGRLVESEPEGVRVGIVRFSAEAGSTVDALGDGSYFTADPARLQVGTGALRVTDRTTSYVAGLSEAYVEMRQELSEADQESLPLSKYVVIFVSDGLPDTDSSSSGGGAVDQILGAVRNLADLAALYRVGAFQFHTAFLTSGPGNSVDRSAQDLLQRMAEAGGGTFRSFASGESLNFLFVDFTVLRRVFTLQSLSAVNLNAVVDDEQVGAYPELVLAREEAQAEEQRLMSEMASAAGLDAGTPDAGPPDAGPLWTPPPRWFVDVDGDRVPGCGEPMVDTDGDGLADEIETLVGTDPMREDTDDDGLRDRLEWRLRNSDLDPLDPDDARCVVPDRCFNRRANGVCDCLIDVPADPSLPFVPTLPPVLDADGNPVLGPVPACACSQDPDSACIDGGGHDCVDLDADDYCDCLDLDRDGACDHGDRDRDGLRDCEEVIFGTAQNGADSDADGFPDMLEARFDSNPVQRDTAGDVDWDRATTGSELAAGTDPWCDESGVRSKVAYRYRMESKGLQGSSTCYAFDIGNISLMPTLANERSRLPGNGYNRVLVFAGEVAFDDPDAFASYRVACVMARYEPDGNYKNPPSGRVRLRPQDFIELGEFDVDAHCIWP